MHKLQVTLEELWARIYPLRRKGATLALCLLAAWVAYHVIFGANGMMEYSHKRSEYHSLNKEIEDLKQENEHLSHQVKALKTDPKTIEKEAREQLRYARPGEVIYTLPQPQQTPSSITAQKH